MTALKDTPLRVEAGFARRFVAAASADERTVASALRLAMRTTSPSASARR